MNPITNTTEIVKEHLITDSEYDEILAKWEEESYGYEDKKLIKFLKSNKAKLIGKTILIDEADKDHKDGCIMMLQLGRVKQLIVSLSINTRVKLKCNPGLDTYSMGKFIYFNLDRVYFVKNTIVQKL